MSRLLQKIPETQQLIQQQITTSRQAQTELRAPQTSISICPSGWRLPTGNTGGEFQALNDAENGGSTSSSSGLLSSWLGMYSGYWLNGFYSQGSVGLYWSSTQYNTTNAYNLNFNSSSVAPGTSSNSKNNGRAVRCTTV